MKIKKHATVSLDRLANKLLWLPVGIVFHNQQYFVRKNLELEKP